MASIDKLIPKIKKWEGGYANNPYDTGGCTMMGITIATFRKYYGADKTCADLKKITEQQWLHILKSGYWNKMQADLIQSQSIANLCVQMCWGSGVVTSIKKIQSCLGITVDGIVGKKTLAALNGDNSVQYHKAVFEKLWEMRKLWLINISKVGNNKVFLKGWLNRLDDYKFED
ncbi:MAG: peptidoglycan domain protein [Bacteroidales bacterium]|nr:peptidoglycan domain protein [Bacteroidales bacterium]